MVRNRRIGGRRTEAVGDDVGTGDAGDAAACAGEAGACAADAGACAADTGACAADAASGAAGGTSGVGFVVMAQRYGGTGTGDTGSAGELRSGYPYLTCRNGGTGTMMVA